MSVVCVCEDFMMTSPPRPPSPPLGPPRGTNFSRRKAMQPFPPSPAFTRIRTSSMNTQTNKLSLFHLRDVRFNADEAAHPAPVPKLDAPGHLANHRSVFP